MGPNGHLPNEMAGKTIAYLSKGSLQEVMLGHLSKENNYDKLAYETVKLEIDLSDNEYKSKDFHIEVAKRSEPSTLLEI